MTLADPDIRHVLAVIMAYDNRKPGEANIVAWTEAARRARWTLDGALDAVHTHFARSTEWIMPGHITEIIRAERRQPPPLREVLGELPSGLPAMRSIPVADKPKRPRPAGKPARQLQLDPVARARARAELDQLRTDAEPGAAS